MFNQYLFGKYLLIMRNENSHSNTVVILKHTHKFFPSKVKPIYPTLKSGLYLLTHF